MHLHSSTEKTKNLLFNGTRAVMGRIWKVDSEEHCSDADACNRVDVTPVHNQQLLKGQTVIGLDGKLKKANAVSGKPGLQCALISHLPTLSQII